MLRWEVCVAPNLLGQRLLDQVVVVVEDTQGFYETDRVGVDVLEFFPRLYDHALLVLDEDYIFENLDVLVFVVLVNFTFIRYYEMGVRKVH